jgi:hypothetical protein
MSARDDLRAWGSVTVVARPRTSYSALATSRTLPPGILAVADENPREDLRRTTALAAAAREEPLERLLEVGHRERNVM